MRNQKSVIFVMTLMVLLIGLTAISAADTGNNTASSVISDNTISADTTSVGSIASTVSDTKTVKSEAKTITKTNSEKLVSDTTKKTIKSNMKNTKKTNSEITVNNDNFDTYFTSNGFTDEVQTGSKINFGTNITRNNHSYVLNKQVTIDGKGNTLSLNTISGSYYGNETGSAFIIDHGASGTQLSNLNFYNTQVFVRNTTDVTVSNVNVTVENQRIGQGVGVFSIRDNASYVTVENSNFKTTNNNGSSTLVLAGASYCNINNNTITGTGDVGNLLYLTTYNVAGVAEDDIELNSYNNITNNVLNGPSTTSIICYGITLTGHDNLIANNIVNVAGQGITTQWGYTDPAAPQNGNNSDRYKGNYYINNTVNRGASFKATNNSTVEYNNITGVVSLGVNTTATNNIFGATTLGNNNIIENNTVNGLVTVSGSNITINHNTIKANINIKKTTYTNVSITNNVIYGVISNNVTVYEYNNTLIPPTNNNKKSLKSMNKIIISASNYLDYFEYDPEDGLYWNYGLPENTWIVINAIPMNVQIAQIILMQNSILEFKNMNTSRLYVWMGTNSTIRNSQMNYSNYAMAIAVGAKCVLDNLTFIANYPELPSNHIDLITQSSTEGIIRNCNIKVNLTTNTIDWSAGESESKIVPIKVKYNNVVLENNNITINVIGTDNSGYPTGYGLSIFANNTTIKNNNINYICKEGLSGWVYPIYVVTSNNTITDNNIVVKGTNYTAGIYFDSTSFSNNTVSNNIINLTCGASGYGEGTTNENVGYGVCFTNRAYGGGSYTTTKGSVFNNKVINNTIYTNGYSSYAVEQFGGDNTLIANNTLILNGTTPMGIGVIGLNTTITGNHITVTGKDNATYPSVDYIRPRTTGVYLSRGINNTVTNNTINSQNNAGIIIDGGETNDIVRYNTVKSLNNTYAVTVTGNNHQVTDNSLVAKELSGDNSVLATGENNTIKDNTGNIGTGVLTITLNPTEAHINDTVVVNVKFVDEDGNAISSKPIHIKVDEFGIDTTVNTNENGIATTDFVVTKLSDTVFVEASYDGTDYAVEGQTAILDITKYETELTVNDQLNVFTPKSNCTINGTLTDKTNPIANAEIIISIANMDGVIVTTDNDGKYSYTFNVGATEGTYNVEVTYNGNDKYEDAVATASYDVEKYGTILKIDPIDNTTPKANMIITGSLVEFYTSEGVANAEITITLNNNTYTNMTDAKGIFKFNIVAPANTGKYTVDASYAGNDTHDMDTDSAEFNVEKIDSSITIDAIGSVDANSNVNVTGILV
ncbi:beta strand repeat-containing protein, partial [Methanosphaera stadtmanae]|uniref:beta strand repeat-containing protein n=1 Tax=Methanosphaera stadtmanae TaxID=2317 RepID=UPI0026747FAB